MKPVAALTMPIAALLLTLWRGRQPDHERDELARKRDELDAELAAALSRLAAGGLTRDAKRKLHKRLAEIRMALIAAENVRAGRNSK